MARSWGDRHLGALISRTANSQAAPLPPARASARASAAFSWGEIAEEIRTAGEVVRREIRREIEGRSVEITSSCSRCAWLSVRRGARATRGPRGRRGRASAAPRARGSTAHGSMSKRGQTCGNWVVRYR